MTEKWTAKQLNDYHRTGKEPGQLNDNTAVRSADVERNPDGKSKAKVATEEADTRCHRISVHCSRPRSTDCGGVSHKAAIDGLVQAGVLQDDSRDYLPEDPKYTEEKCRIGQEWTLITVNSYQPQETQ